MDFFNGIINNDVFVVAFIAWFIAQALKVILTLMKDRTFDISRMVGSGGMPSSHSSSVMGMSTAIGILDGYDSPIYGFAIILSLVVMYDASGVRRSVGKQAIIINKMIIDFYENHHIKEGRLKELVGHTPYEVLAGAALGIVVANLYL
ncbi:MAG: divergent PAP2 family protein [Acidaminobacteraceae bacterium]